MKRVYIYCEGKTEESFINKVLYPYLVNVDICIIPIICETKRKNGVKHKGGVSSYEKIKKELLWICHKHHHEKVTTMFDYYGMPKDTPNIGNNEHDIYKRMEAIEHAVNKDIGMPNLFFGLMLHEFEGILFSQPEAFIELVENEVIEQILNIRTEAMTPEHINNSQETAPSKRLESLIPNYAKVRYGTIVAERIGIDKIMSECRHFAKWIENIRNC